MTYPPWIVLHVPHDSTIIPVEVRDQYLLDANELNAEILRMTDHHTQALFAEPADEAIIVRAPVSRLVVDVERFCSDDEEPMAKRGMGCIYTRTADLKELRRALLPGEREFLLQRYYAPHHAMLEAAVTERIQRYGQCLVIDCHSFPDQALPYEQVDPRTERPDICIGADEFHTTAALADAFLREFRTPGWTVKVNDPFAGALVPGSRYRHDPRVLAIMVEVNRRLYLDQEHATRLPAFSEVAAEVKARCINAVRRHADATLLNRSTTHGERSRRAD